MFRKLSVGLIAAALLLSAALVGVSYGGGGGIADPAGQTQPTVLKLWWNTERQDSEVRVFLFDEHGGRCGEEDEVCGQITEKDMPLFDVDGNRVGRQHISCMASDVTEWVCHQISVIKDGPNTDPGQVTTFGVKNPSEIYTIPVTGGTGAYEGVGGHARQVGQDGRVTYTLFLEP